MNMPYPIIVALKNFRYILSLFLGETDGMYGELGSWKGGSVSMLETTVNTQRQTKLINICVKFPMRFNLLDNSKFKR